MGDLRTYDVVILGTGPAGLQAAIHAARKKVSVLVLGKQAKSSLFRAHIENFCCIFNLAGEEMLRVGREQAVRFGAEILDEDVLKVSHATGLFSIRTESGRELASKSLVIATGSKRNRLGVSGEKEFLGRGVSYCVDCDGNFFKGEKVAVIGGESAAVSGAMDLLQIASRVHLICNRLQVVESLARELESSAVEVHEKIQVKKIIGEQAVEALILSDGSTLPINGVFIELGAKGVMELAGLLGVRLDETATFIETDKKQATNVVGVYAAGDICGQPWQMAKAVGEGCVAGIEAANYAKKLAISES